MKNKFMQRAIELSIESINSGGGPFGSVIAKGDKIIPQLNAPATPEAILMSIKDLKSRL